MKILYRILILVSLSGAVQRSYCQTYLEWTGTSPFFTNGVSNLVSYIDLGNIAVWGSVEVSLTASYHNQNSTGIYKKHYNIGRAVSSGPHSSSSEVSAVLGPIGNQWHLGEFEVNSSNHLVIPIYHLVSTGNNINVHLKVFAENTVSSSTFTITSPTSHSSTIARHYPFFSEKISVGTSKADVDALLIVAGNINSREIKVKVDAGADFVFDDGYKLMSLDETEKFIKEKKHLPEIPSAEEMKEWGLKLGVINIKMLQKIEELTLYLIEQDKKAQKQEMELIRLTNRVQSLSDLLKVFDIEKGK